MSRRTGGLMLIGFGLFLTILFCFCMADEMRRTDILEADKAVAYLYSLGLIALSIFPLLIGMNLFFRPHSD